MRRREARLWWVRGAIATALLVPLLLWVSGCWLFNVPPDARFTISASVIEEGQTITFSAILSSDEDGIIAKFEWDFGDGASATGESVSHKYNVTGSFTVVLRVTDDDGATATAQKVITVNPAEDDGDGAGGGPTATFTATPLTGNAPLTVTFNASASSYAGHAITAYFWDFGDGTSGAGITTTHTYAPTATRSYNVVLRIIASDNTEDTATKTITAVVAGATPPANAPTASFTANPNKETSPAEIDFDPEDSDAAAGRVINTYVWSYGDGSTQTKTTDDIVTHVYHTSQPSEEFLCTLTVIDDHGAPDSMTRTITVENRKPIAGFDWSDDNQVTWQVDDIELDGCQTAPQTIWFRSLNPNWGGLNPATQRPNESTEKPANFETGAYDSGDRNLSYDPEGQWIWGDGWGIVNYRWDMGDGFAAVGPAVADDPDADYTDSGGFLEWSYNYQLAEDEQARTFTVSVQVMDEEGQWSTAITRTVKLNKE